MPTPVAPPAAPVIQPTPVQPVIVNVGDKTAAQEPLPDNLRTAYVRDATGVVQEIQKWDGDKLVSRKVVERDKENMIVGWLNVPTKDNK